MKAANRPVACELNNAEKIFFALGAIFRPVDLEVNILSEEIFGEYFRLQQRKRKSRRRHSLSPFFPGRSLGCPSHLSCVYDSNLWEASALEVRLLEVNKSLQWDFLVKG